jgi:transcription elongation GreA/GreB family factor
MEPEDTSNVRQRFGKEVSVATDGQGTMLRTTFSVGPCEVLIEEGSYSIGAQLAVGL